MNRETEMMKIKSVYPDAELWEEGGEPLVFIPGLAFHSGGKTVVRNALLCPRKHSSAGYPTRLFLSGQVPGRGNNWSQHVIRGDNGWFSPSYNDVPAEMPWLDILAAHLRGYS